MFVSKTASPQGDYDKARNVAVNGRTSLDPGPIVIPRMDTAALWTSNNPTLDLNEIGWESDTGKCKKGTGSTAWASLGYFTPVLNNIPTPTGTVQMGGQYVSNVAAPFFGNDAANKTYVDSGTKTLTNTRITARITTITSSGTPTVNTDNCDAVTITAQAAAITSMTTNLTGTPLNFDKLTIRIKDDGTARAITWGASFASRGGTLPTTTVISKVTTVGLIYNTVTSTWDCVAVAQEA